MAAARTGSRAGSASATRAASARSRTLATIGYEGVSMEEFLTKLRKARVKHLIDVRQVAFSRKRGFSKKALGEALASVGVRYDHLPSLGSPAAARKQVRIDHNWPRLFAATRKAYRSEESEAALEQLKRIARSRKSALLCFCASSRQCHRRVLVEKLEPEGFVFEHL